MVRVGREIAGSLSIRYVSSTVTTAAADLLGTTTTLWLRGEDQDFHAVHRSTDPHGAPAPSTLVAAGRRAHRGHRRDARSPPAPGAPTRSSSPAP